MNITLSFRGHLFKLRPLWALVAGFLASSGSLPLPYFLLFLFLVEGIMPGWWHSLMALAGTNSPPLPSTGKSFVLPYAVPDSIAWKIAETVGRLLVWWKEAFWPKGGKTFVSFLFFTLLAFSLALSHEPEVGPILVLAAAFGCTGAVLLRQGRDPAFWKSLYEITVPWLIGYAAGRSLEFLPFASAIAFGVVAWGLENQRARWRNWPVFGPLGLLFLVFWFEGRFLMAGGLACLTLGLVGIDSGRRHHLTLLALLLTALALRQGLRS